MEGRASTPTPAAARKNIETVADIERSVIEHRDWAGRLAHAIASFTGSLPFVIVHLVWFGIWVTVNSGKVGVRPFDPYPFVLLALIVSCEGVLLTTFVLIEQNMMTRSADQRDHLNLQIDLLAEREITKVLQLQRLICKKLDIAEASDAETSELSQTTAVEELASELQEKLPQG